MLAPDVHRLQNYLEKRVCERRSMRNVDEKIRGLTLAQRVA